MSDPQFAVTWNLPFQQLMFLLEIFHLRSGGVGGGETKKKNVGRGP